MRIGIHLQSLRPGKIGGHEEYVRQLVRLLPQVDRDARLTLFCADYNASTFVASPRVDVQVLDDREFTALNAGGLRRHQLDVWFCPLLVLEPHDPGIPAVVNIPDLQHETFPGFFSERVLEWRKEHYPRSARVADAVLTQSEFSRQQIVDALEVPAHKVHAIHLGAAPEFSPEVAEDSHYLRKLKRRYDLPDGFLYYPANNWPHKNHEVLFEALRMAEAQLDLPMHLVLTGAEVEGVEPWERVIRARGVADRVRYLGYLPLEEIPGLYALSLSLVFPSLFEGFGIPIVEAMRTGCPVICSNATGLPEVGGDAALYFDPESPDELAAAIGAVVSGRGSELVDAGHRRAKEFSWERTARSTLDVMRTVAGKVSAGVEVSSASSTPLISIVTPSFEQGRFIERTLKSVLEQGYPRMEYWVIDGGSKDGTVETLERYQRLYPGVFHYVSEPDGGQAEAVNKGLARVRGDIIGWLNSDDTYERGSLAAVARAFEEHPGCDIVYGRARYISDSAGDDAIGTYPTRPRFNWDTLVHECYICQPTVFWQRSINDQGYRLDEGLHLCMDYDFWIRLGRHFRFYFLDEHLANSRVYPENKTLSQRRLVFEESFKVVKGHYGWVPWSWTIGRAHFRRAEEDSFFNPRPVAPTTYLSACLSLFRHNWSTPRSWARIAREVKPVLAQIPGKLLNRLTPSARRTLTVPASCLVVEIGVEVASNAPGSSSIDLSWAGHRLARFSVNGPGRYTRRISLPEKKGSRPYRLTLYSDLLRTGAARVLEPQAYALVSEDGWLEQRDTLRLPAGWSVVEMAFMLPAGADDGIRLTFDYNGRTIDQWMYDQPGVYRRKLRLPQRVSEDEGDTELDFACSAALPPEPWRGENRRLAMRVHQIVDRTPGNDEVLW